MEESEVTRIKQIKTKVSGMLEERHLLQNGEAEIVSPSQYWTDFCSYFDYMLGLSEESFAKLRLHTYHLTSDVYLTYIFGNSSSFKAKADRLATGLPPKFVLNEPEGGIGFRYDDGRFISKDILRYQKAIRTLYRYGILDNFLNNDPTERMQILEIGGGYGGLAHHLSNIVGNAAYIIIDLPETLLFSASYLSLLNPEKKLYLYKPGDFSAPDQVANLDSYDFVLLPNYLLDSVHQLHPELVVNMASFQEMRTEQVDAYLDFIEKTCTGMLYSFNQDRKPANQEIVSLSAMLNSKFDVIEVVKPKKSKSPSSVKGKLKSWLNGGGKRNPASDGEARWQKSVPYREYICKPSRYNE